MTSLAREANLSPHVAVVGHPLTPAALGSASRTSGFPTYAFNPMSTKQRSRFRPMLLSRPEASERQSSAIFNHIEVSILSSIRTADARRDEPFSTASLMALDQVGHAGRMGSGTATSCGPSPIGNARATERPGLGESNWPLLQGQQGKPSAGSGVVCRSLGGFSGSHPTANHKLFARCSAFAGCGRAGRAQGPAPVLADHGRQAADTLRSTLEPAIGHLDGVTLVAAPRPSTVPQNGVTPHRRWPCLLLEL